LTSKKLDKIPYPLGGESGIRIFRDSRFEDMPLSKCDGAAIGGSAKINAIDFENIRLEKTKIKAIKPVILLSEKIYIVSAGSSCLRCCGEQIFKAKEKGLDELINVRASSLAQGKHLLCEKDRESFDQSWVGINSIKRILSDERFFDLELEKPGLFFFAGGLAIENAVEFYPEEEAEI
jgi:hypothetical protein